MRQSNLFAAPAPAAAGQTSMFVAEGPSVAVLDLLRRLGEGRGLADLSGIERAALVRAIELGYVTPSGRTLTPRGAAQLRG